MIARMIMTTTSFDDKIYQNNDYARKISQGDDSLIKETDYIKFDGNEPPPTMHVIL